MKKVLKITLWVLLGLVVLGTFYFLYQKSKPKIIRYEIETVTSGSIEKRTVATGKVEPRNEILIKPQMSGIISEVYKQAGDAVKAGDVIAKIKVVPDMVNLNASESRVQLAKLAYEQALTVYNRDKALFDKKVISKEEFEKSTLTLNNNKEELKTAQDNLSLVREGISSRTAAYSNTLVRSTVTGTILDVPVKVGNSVIQSNNFNDGTTIATVANLNDMLFVGKLDETEVGRIHTGMPMTITIGALQDHKLAANLEYIAPKGTEESGAIMFQMKASVKIPSDIFVRAGYSANAEIMLEQAIDVLTIPESCLEFSNDSAFVYLLTKDEPQEFKKTVVKTGLSDGINIQLTQGLKLGEKIRGAEIVEKKKENVN
ncbi:MAG: efflux RND transporter periplasmic adaptor subunit [Bacteroidia bacterium]|nr:efflux RND transporter periplasmic adaptor subunit [Bacteroidia bacterium]HRG02789.1 efflux RND transporter periplasmic adaptor subunit [Paludibacteraceae bacterium]